MTSVDVAVIGRGLIGSAAARHLAESGVSAALIGPAEPADRKASPGPFSSHPDEGRITRIADRRQIWADLAARSIRRYRDIESRSGVRFHTPAGLAVAVADLGDWIDAGLVAGSNIHKVSADSLRSATGISITSGLEIGVEGAPAGHINPRRLVVAQTRLAAQAGATVVEEAVTDLVRTNDHFDISGAWGSLRADRVLLATGAFGQHLIDKALAVERKPRTVVLAEMVDPGGIPSLIIGDPPDSRLEGAYWVPPVEYPDGRLCLKIGGTLRADRTAETDDELVEWFHGDGDPVEIEALQVSLGSLLPDVDVVSYSSSPCVITETPSGLPYLGFVDDGLAVALAGNGSAAKSSDELGRLASLLFAEGGWSDPLDAGEFTPQLN